VHTQIHTVVPGSLGISKLLYLTDNSLAKKGEFKTALVTKNGIIMIMGFKKEVSLK